MVDEVEADKDIDKLGSKGVEGKNESSKTIKARDIYEVGDLKSGIDIHLSQLRPEIVKNIGSNDIQGDESKFKEKTIEILKLKVQDHWKFDGVGYIKVDEKNFDKRNSKKAVLPN